MNFERTKLHLDTEVVQAEYKIVPSFRTQRALFILDHLSVWGISYYLGSFQTTRRFAPFKPWYLSSTILQTILSHEAEYIQHILSFP